VKWIILLRLLSIQKEIIISEWVNNRLQIFNYQGNHLKFIGENELKYPTFMSLNPQGNIYVINYNNEENQGNIKVFNLESGQLIHTFGNTSLPNPYGIAYQSDFQQLWVTDFDHHNIFAF